ncbi:MAG: hypothetical protein JWQ35_2623 [Bacteriovoracaceae bacterium]|nr:hypothetical protein [Bacteriovoracaceae bacterium]
MKVSFLCLGLLVSLTGCATNYENTALKAWDQMKRGQTDDAVKTYEKEVTSDKDKLLKLMDEGILFRTAGRFEESNSKFLEASRIIDQNGYLSLGEQSVTVLTNEKQTTYQGEDFEKVLIHLYLGLNFLSLNNPDDALVETRRVNEILFKMISEAKRPYELNAFASYLGGVLFEQDGDYNNALVSYRDALKVDPKLNSYFPAIRQDLIRMAKQMGMDQELEEFKTKFGKSDYDQALQTLKDRAGSILLLFENGKSPQKYSSRESHQRGQGPSATEVVFPIAYYKKRPFNIGGAILEVNGRGAKTAVLNNIETTAIKQLKDRMGRAVAKALLTAGVKAGVATGVAMATKSKELGLLTGLALVLISEADTRSWLLLPAELQAAKLFLPAGKYDVKISYLNEYGAVVDSETVAVNVTAKKTTFIQRRKFD